MSLYVWETRQQIVKRLQGLPAIAGKLALGAGSVFDSRPDNDPLADEELPAIVVDTPQDTWQPKSIQVPTYEGKTNVVIELHLAETGTISRPQVAKLRDELTDAIAEAVIGDCDIWDEYEKPDTVTISRTMSIQGSMRAGSQIVFTLTTTQEIQLDYGTPTPLDGIDATVELIDPPQGDAPNIQANWDV